ncbi:MULTISPECIES: aminoacyl-tRNA hydrolase [Maribellus]|uniref:Peptidyl-tRNA hydrolase n=1 Tax=Maribellus comscasis TaxID=2681766 RepID=A0A6I6JX56_9BACT|nr:MULTISPECIES: aminoacyl-tRNA hydrolase [Maribellus]MCG6188400.1 aminoacyl-tRNA hydrolase [Maribellus maritimus]QGY42344.1 aminoacyl-tRNA hydrolase [Maribellus comscasis]
MKYLIAGLGNIGPEYKNTRHNIGFQILDALAEASNISFNDKRYGFVAEYKFKARTFILLKPSTYMNLSGRAVNYWMQKENIGIENILVLVDDIALPFGTIRLRAKGSDGGHNGLKNINQVLGRNDYARLRFGIGDDFHKGFQVDYVLSDWTKDEQKEMPEKLDHCIEMIKGFGTIGIERTMNFFNKKK